MSRRAAAAGRDLGAVVDAFLGDERETGAPPLVTAAPGSVDTAAVLATLRRGEAGPEDLALPGSGPQAPIDWNATGRRPVLAWCPRGDEADALAPALALGRLVARLQPASLLVLWHPSAGEPPGREPVSARVGRASALARRAAPGVPVRVHCVGWTRAAPTQIADVGKRFA